MQNNKIIYLYIFNLFIINHVVSQKASSICGQPSIPYKSRYYPDDNKIYIEDDKINYLCENKFIDLIQTNTCKKGRWTGNSPICGQTTKGNPMTDVNNVIIFKDLETNAYITIKGNIDLIDEEGIGNRLFIKGLDKLPQTSSHYSLVINLAKGRVIQLLRLSVNLKSSLHTQMTFSVDIGSQRKCEININLNETSSYPNSDKNFPLRIRGWFLCENSNINDFNKESNTISWTIDFDPNEKSTIMSADVYIVEPYKNNNHNPICGIPENPIGIELKYVVKDVQYKSQCVQDFKQVEEKVPNIFNCTSNMKWSGEYPLCAPIKACRRLSDDHNISKIYQYNKAYFINQTAYYAVIGTIALVECTNGTNSNFNMTIVCGENYEWNDTCGGKVKSSTTISTTEDITKIYKSTNNEYYSTQNNTKHILELTTPNAINTKKCNFKGEFNGLGNWPSVQTGEVSKVICPQGIGYAVWKCMDNGKFDDNGPDFTQCNK